jgi:membrane protease YdiL (CAAX protease family)
MIQGYRMAGPPPHGDRPQAPAEERQWPIWIGFAAFALAFLVSNLAYALLLVISGADVDKTPAWLDLSSAVILEASLIGIALWAASLFRPLRASEFGLRPTRFWRAVGWAALGIVAFVVFLLIWTAIFGEPTQDTAEEVGANESQLALIAAGVLFVVFAPVGEEFFFRGFFYGSLRSKLSPGWAALINGTVFGAIHASTGVSAVPPLIFLGVVLCLIREKTGSLYPCIAIHALNNSLAYGSLDGADPGFAAALGVAMLAACSLVPRVASRAVPAGA